MIRSRSLHQIVKKYLLKHDLQKADVKYLERLPCGNSPFIPACTQPDPETRIQTIYILEVMDDDVISASKELQPSKVSTFLTTEELFFRHTVLHEICHILNRHNNSDFHKRLENEHIADTWAYVELKREING